MRSPPLILYRDSRKCGILLTFVNGSVGVGLILFFFLVFIGVGLILSTCQAAKEKKKGISFLCGGGWPLKQVLRCLVSLLCSGYAPFESQHLALSLLLQPTPLFCMNLIHADNAIIYGCFFHAQIKLTESGQPYLQ